MSSLRLAYHESGHALIARDLGRRVESVAISPDGGAVHEEPLAPNGTPEEIERGLVVVFAGLAAQNYAPPGPISPAALEKADSNGGIVPGLVALRDVDFQATPSDDDVVEHYRERIGDEAVERAKVLAYQLVDRKYLIGQLQQIADELLWRGVLSGDDLEKLLASPA
jgi:hypothetical protein